MQRWVRERLGWTIALLAFVVAGSVADARADVLLFGGGSAFGDEAPWYLRAPDRSLALTGDRSHVVVTTDGDGGMVFGAPPGQRLAPGRYAQALPSRTLTEPVPGYPWVDQWYLGCSVFGEFEVRDIAFSPAGVPVRAWIVFELACNFPTRRSTHGELRVGYPPETGVEPVARVTRFPTAHPGAPPRSLPVRMYAGRAPAAFGAAAITGADADRFTVIDNDCSGVEVPVGGHCDVRVSFDPAETGRFAATLRLAHSGGTATSELESAVTGGRTRLLLHSTGDEPVGGGWDWEFTTADSLAVARGVSPTWQEFWFDNPDNPYWDRFSVTLRGPEDDDDFAFSPGVYDHAIVGGAQVPTVYADAPGSTEECDRERTRVEVLQADYDPAFQPRAFSAFFTIWCRSGGTLEGLVEYEATIAEPELPWPFDPDAVPPPEEEAPPGEEQEEESGGEGPMGGEPVAPIGGTGGFVPPDRPAIPQPRPFQRPALTPPFPAPPQILPVTAFATCDRDRDRGLRLMRGTRAGDRLAGTSGRDRILGLGGGDRVDGAAGDDCLDGGVGHDLLRGGAGDDVLVGAEGRDVLEGGIGDDVLVGGLGRDVLRCGRGNDLAVVSPGDRATGCERRSTRRP